ncbi:MAG: hypothetical protein K2F93_05670, partial [Muribaculaceae bacterium]|nr:hypothetical protein [Muribaculaceae bacterium]
MKYQNIKYIGAEATVALFETGRKEAHAYILPSDTEAGAEAQIKAIAEAADRLAADTGLTPVFKRYLLSDPSNQMRL